jgi:hypothetical protein
MMKMSKKAAEALAEALHFVEKMQALKDEWWLPVGRQARTRCDISKQMRGLLDEIEQFDKSLGPGLSVGRFVPWFVDEGREAPYLVVGIGRREVQVARLPTLEAATSPVVAGGRALRLAVERALYVKDWHRTHPNGLLIVNDD